jgi:chaperonin GroEL (HSP60 family)
MLKMLLDPMGGIVITNDGNAILREIDVAHPAAKSMLELARSQDEEVGDGTTSVIILAGEMLVVAEPFVSRGMHPTVIVRAYRQALDAALEIAEGMAIKIDTSNAGAPFCLGCGLVCCMFIILAVCTTSDEMLRLVRSCIGTKFSSRYGDLIVKMAIDAVKAVTVDVRRWDHCCCISVPHCVQRASLSGFPCYHVHPILFLSCSLVAGRKRSTLSVTPRWKSCPAASLKIAVSWAVSWSRRT